MHTETPTTPNDARKIKHLIEPEPYASFNQVAVDPEDQPGRTIPQALDGKDLFNYGPTPRDEPTDMDTAPPQLGETQAQETYNAGFVETYEDVFEDTDDEMVVVDLFGDFDQALNEDATVSALMTAGVNQVKAHEITESMSHRTPTASFIEVYASHWSPDATSMSKDWTLSI